MSRFSVVSGLESIILVWACAVMAANAQTFTKLVDFDHTNGTNPEQMSLTQGRDGNLYGTTLTTAFKVTPKGKLTTLHTFCSETNCADGSQPDAGLVLATDGNFYGTTLLGGDVSCPFYGTCGTVFRITAAGKLTTLYSFCSQPGCIDGELPRSPLIQAADGNFYGTASQGGVSSYCSGGCGTAFKMTPAGTLTTLHLFDFFVDGDQPNGLIQASDGEFYGTTVGGLGNGNVFRMTTTGFVTNLHSFLIALGSTPRAGLVQANDGILYGTTQSGTAFDITLGGEYAFLMYLPGEPYAGLVQGTDGNFYGTTFNGGDLTCGSTGCGSIFQITPAGVVTTLHNFEITDGEVPYGGLFQATDGNFYGTTTAGGTNGDGTLFKLSMGLGPFVSLVRNSGVVGKTAGILGRGFTGTTNVSFNGVPAAFTVVSNTYLEATVPAGATTGSVTVASASRVLTSNKVFRVTPQLLTFDPPSGPVGTTVTITGNSLSQATDIRFGDHAHASFSVDSDMQITATVPGGARTGQIGIQTPGGTAMSSAVFTVTH